MASAAPNDDAHAHALREAIGYLNFSSGASDPCFLRALDALFASSVSGDEQGGGSQHGDGEKPSPAASLGAVLATLDTTCERLSQEDDAFGDVVQANKLISAARLFCESYQGFHGDLLGDTPPDRLWNGFMLGRVFETLLAGEHPPDDSQAIDAARDRFDDFLGYRPVAVLETEQKIEPYRQEWVRPTPLVVKGAGTASGPYQQLIDRALEILADTAPDLLRAAAFDPDMLEELAVDPREYDFDHPVHKRPNHHFGLWDPNRIDGSGFYRRFVLQPVVLEALMSRVDTPAQDRTRAERLEEAATVLAGTILMASGVSGQGPGAHSSEETLSTLLPEIAAYRDRYYSERLAKMNGEHARRLHDEAERMRQPFAGARQHLNHEIAGRRADQLQRVQLARVFARMGRPEVAIEHARQVRVASARLLCEIDCRITAGHRRIDARDLAGAEETVVEIRDLIDRGIRCGALVDPWNIVGFGGNFSLFPAMENTVHDYRVDDLILMVEQLLGLCSRACTEAAALDDEARESSLSERLSDLATWWDQFATPIVADVRRLLAKEVEVSTNLVAGALGAWRKAGAEAGDIRFWGMFVDQFDTPQSFQLVIEALLEQEDTVASMALLMRWLCQVDLTPLEEGEASFRKLALRWLALVEKRSASAGEHAAVEDGWPQVVRFFEHLEANAEDLWRAPRWDVGELPDDDALDDLLDGDEDYEEDEDDEAYGDDLFDDGEDEDDELGLFSAAYEGVTFEDSADDGMDSSIYEPSGDETRMELEEEAKRVAQRLSFLKTVAKLWRRAAITWGVQGGGEDQRSVALRAWRKEAAERCVGLGQLLEAIHRHRLPTPRGSHESMVEFDRVRAVKEKILDRTVAACVEMADTARLLRAASGALALDEAESSPDPERERHAPIKLSGGAIGVLRSVLRGDAAAVCEQWPHMLQALRGERLLYVPMTKGGDPRAIVRARTVHRLIHALVTWLPKLGLVRETCELLDVAQAMENDRPNGPGAVTEYDRLFEAGYEALVRCLVESASVWSETDRDGSEEARPIDALLVEAVQNLTESQLDRWLRHSKTVRLSVVERIGSPQDWQRFVSFVRAHGDELFTQRFLILSNLRGILHQGIGEWLDHLRDEEPEMAPLVAERLDADADRAGLEWGLTLAIETVVENYREYRDYNSTTTQSDHGNLLHVFVDFVRVRNAYDRVAWNLKPVYLAHRILEHGNRPAAAELWRRAVAERTADAADQHQARLRDMEERHGMRLPSVSDRVGERFVRPLTIDRLKNLVDPAVNAAGDEAEQAFAALSEEIASLMQHPTGAGLDSPDWLIALEEEVEAHRAEAGGARAIDDPLQRVPQVLLTWDEAQRQLSDIAERHDESES